MPVAVTRTMTGDGYVLERNRRRDEGAGRRGVKGTGNNEDDDSIW